MVIASISLNHNTNKVVLLATAMPATVIPWLIIHANNFYFEFRLPETRLNFAYPTTEYQIRSTHIILLHHSTMTFSEAGRCLRLGLFSWNSVQRTHTYLSNLFGWSEQKKKRTVERMLTQGSFVSRVLTALGRAWEYKAKQTEIRTNLLQKKWYCEKSAAFIVELIFGQPPGHKTITIIAFIINLFFVGSPHGRMANKSIDTTRRKYIVLREMPIATSSERISPTPPDNTFRYMGKTFFLHRRAVYGTYAVRGGRRLIEVLLHELTISIFFPLLLFLLIHACACLSSIITASRPSYRSTAMRVPCIRLSIIHGWIYTRTSAMATAKIENHRGKCALKKINM